MEQQQKNDEVSIWIREPVQSDWNRVKSDWLRSYKHVGHNQWLPWQHYKKIQRQIIENILKRSKVLVACFSDQPNSIIGWLCYEPVKLGATTLDIIHYINVAERYRGHGAGRFLLSKTNSLIKNKTNKVPRLYASHASPFVYLIKEKIMVIYVPDLVVGDTSGIIL